MTKQPDYPRPRPLTPRLRESMVLHRALSDLMRRETTSDEERAGIRFLLTVYDGAWMRDRSTVLTYGAGRVYVWCPALFPPGSVPHVTVGASRLTRVLQQLGRKERMG